MIYEIETHLLSTIKNSKYILPWGPGAAKHKVTYKTFQRSNHDRLPKGCISCRFLNSVNLSGLKFELIVELYKLGELTQNLIF